MAKTTTAAATAKETLPPMATAMDKDPAVIRDPVTVSAILHGEEAGTNFPKHGLPIPLP
jgi:hypothetical protein